MPRPTSLLPGDVVLPSVSGSPTPVASGTAGIPVEGPRLKQISIVVIDAGHGGDDLGVHAAGDPARAMYEKDLDLTLAKKIETTVTAQTGARVLLSRSADVHLGISDRASFANDVRADLFVSIHADASPASSARGFRVYYHDPSNANAALPAAGPGETPAALAWSAAQRGENESKSARFAQIVDASLAAKVTLADRGVTRMPMAVLEGSTCPAVLVEVGFLSNPDEALALGTGAVQDAIADAVADAVLKMDASLAGAEGNP